MGVATVLLLTGLLKPAKQAPKDGDGVHLDSKYVSPIKLSGSGAFGTIISRIEAEPTVLATRLVTPGSMPVNVKKNEFFLVFKPGVATLALGHACCALISTVIVLPLTVAYALCFRQLGYLSSGTKLLGATPGTPYLPSAMARETRDLVFVLGPQAAKSTPLETLLTFTLRELGANSVLDFEAVTVYVPGFTSTL
jgi:hypothetical protein